MENTNLVYNEKSNVLDLVKKANKVRLDNKNKWYQLTFENETSGDKTFLKCFGTWVQLSAKPIFSTSMDNTPTQFKSNIEKGLKTLTTL